jgi:hypothetical protein
LQRCLCSSVIHQLSSLNKDGRTPVGSHCGVDRYVTSFGWVSGTTSAKWMIANMA